MSDPVAAVRETMRTILHTQHDGWRDVVRGLDSDTLNWKPGEETNSIAVLISHALDAERFCIANSVDAVIDRDREAKFRVTASSSDELLALINEVESDENGYLDALTSEYLSQDVTRGERTRTGSWWLLHSIEHSCEHLGQSYLTKQLWEQRG